MTARYSFSSASVPAQTSDGSWVPYEAHEEMRRMFAEELAIAHAMIAKLQEECIAWRGLGIKPMTPSGCRLSRAIAAVDAAKALDADYGASAFSVRVLNRTPDDLRKGGCSFACWSHEEPFDGTIECVVVFPRAER